MDATLSALLTFYLFSTGRRIFALREVQALAKAGGHDALVAHCEAAIAHDCATRDTEALWATDKEASQYAPEAKQIDIHVDTALGALRDAINAESRGAAVQDYEGEAAMRLEEELFPRGVAAITTLPFIDELGELERILARVKSPEWEGTIKDLGLSRRVARLGELEQKYRAALTAPAKTVAFADVKNARAKGQSMMLQAAAMVLGIFPSDGEADVISRRKLLGPILQQNEAIRAYLRARRAIEDVNPETGQVEAAPGPT